MPRAALSPRLIRGPHCDRWHGSGCVWKPHPARAQGWVGLRRARRVVAVPGGWTCSRAVAASADRPLPLPRAEQAQCGMESCNRVRCSDVVHSGQVQREPHLVLVGVARGGGHDDGAGPDA